MSEHGEDFEDVTPEVFVEGFNEFTRQEAVYSKKFNCIFIFAKFPDRIECMGCIEVNDDLKTFSRHKEFRRDLAAAERMIN